MRIASSKKRWFSNEGAIVWRRTGVTFGRENKIEWPFVCVCSKGAMALVKDFLIPEQSYSSIIGDRLRGGRGRLIVSRVPGSRKSWEDETDQQFYLWRVSEPVVPSRCRQRSKSFCLGLSKRMIKDILGK